VIPLGDGGRQYLQSCKRKFASDSDACSDHLALIHAFNSWQDLGGGARQHRFSASNSLSPATMKMISRMREQIEGELVCCGLLQARNCVQEMSSSAGSAAVLRCVLVRCLC
jgi:ATP-dependent RNA helicase YTHDC2